MIKTHIKITKSAIILFGHFYPQNIVQMPPSSSFLPLLLRRQLSLNPPPAREEENREKNGWSLGEEEESLSGEYTKVVGRGHELCHLRSSSAYCGGLRVRQVCLLSPSPQYALEEVSKLHISSFLNF